MIVIYDMDKTLAAEEDHYFVRFQGQELPLDIDKLRDLFAWAVEEYDGFNPYEKALKANDQTFAHMLGQLSGVLPVPANPYADVDDKDFVLGLLRFLWNVNQRTVKRDICEVMLFKERAE